MSNVVNEQKDKRLKELEKNIENAKAKKKEFMRTHDYNGHYISEESLNEYFDLGYLDTYYRGYPEFIELSDNLERCKRELEFYNLWKKFEPIKDIIESYKKEIGFVDGDDYFEYKLNSFDNKFFLGFDFRHYNGKKYYAPDCASYYDKGFDTLYGFILYDSDGKVYLSEKTMYDKGWISSFERGIGSHCGDFYQKFIDREYMYHGYDRNNVKLCKFVDGHYELVRNFGKCKIDVLPTLWDKKILMIDREKLYSVEEDKFVNVNELGGSLQTCDNNGSGVHYWYSDKVHDEEVDNKQKELITKHLRDYNLLLSKNDFTVKYDRYSKDYQTMCFVDMTGHIVSGLYVISSSTYKCDIYEISDDTYEEVFKKVKEIYTKKLKREIQQREAAKKAANTRREKNMLLNQKELFEKIKEFTPSKVEKSPKKVLQPKKNEKRKND